MTPILDAISIYIKYSVLNKVLLGNTFKIKINTSWIIKEKKKYKEELVNFYENKKHLLSNQSLTLLEQNPIKLLKSKIEDEQIIAKNAPSIIKFLKKDSKIHYEKFKEYFKYVKYPIWRR